MLLNLAVGIIFGLTLGSLSKCLADRCLSNEKFTGRSYCPHCKHTLRAYDLIPILSFLLTKGKCRYCHKRIPPEYPLSELFFAGLLGLLFYLSLPVDYFFSLNLFNLLPLFDVVYKTFIISVLFITFLTDIKTGIIPDRITYPAIKIALTYLVFVTIYKVFLIYQSLISNPLGKYLLPPNSDYLYRHSLGAAEPLIIGLLSALGVAIFFGALIIGTRGRGMGGGDLKLGAFLGLVLGFPGVIIALMLSFLSGSIVGVFLLILRKRGFGQTIPFGPFLSLGSFLTLLWGENILNWYLNLTF